MAHVYTTEALLVLATDVGEGSRILLLYTREFGLVRALARSARETRSKLRPNLQPYTLLDVSLVRGKELWRVVGARERENLYHRYALDAARLGLIGGLCVLIRRLVHGEESNPELFELILHALDFLQDERLSEEDVKLCESILISRVLHRLGYFGRHERLGDLPETLHFTPELLTRAAPLARQLIGAINASLAASHL